MNKTSQTLVDWVLLGVQPTVFQLYSAKRGRDGPTGVTTFECQWKRMDNWVWSKNVGSWCSLNTLPTMSQCQTFRIKTPHIPHPLRGNPYPPPGYALSSSLGLSPGCLHQYQADILVILEYKFEDAKVVTRSRKLKDREYNDQKKKDKRTNKDSTKHYTTTADWATRTPLKT